MFEGLPALSVLPFFQVKIDLYYAEMLSKVATQKKYKLPSSAAFLDEQEFSQFFVGWNRESLYFHLEVSQPFEEVNAMDFRKGDSLEILLDTRDIKDKTFVSQFCHHFVFFPEKVNGHFGKEITRFRTEQIHPLCDPKDLITAVYYGKKSYVLDVEIPSSALFGYDPIGFHRLGFTYRVNRKGGDPQHFVLSSSEYKIEKQPSLWSTLELVT